jgi:hypothetical protein
MDTPITISDRNKPAAHNHHLNIGALIFPRLDQIDLTGPFEVLSRIPNSIIHVIAKTKFPVRDIQGEIRDHLISNRSQRGLVLPPHPQPITGMCAR